MLEVTLLPIQFRTSCSKVALRETMTSLTTPHGLREVTYSDSELRHGSSGFLTSTMPGSFHSSRLILIPLQTRPRSKTTRPTSPADSQPLSLRPPTICSVFSPGLLVQLPKHSTSLIAPPVLVVVLVQIATSTTTPWLFMAVTPGV